MKYTTVVFDLDGTLVDTAPGIEDALVKAISQTLAGEHNLPADIRREFSSPIHEVIKKLLPTASTDIVIEVEKQFRLIYDSTGWQRTVVYKHVKDVLKWLNKLGVSCFVVTNKPQLPTFQILKKLDLAKYFKDIISPDIKQPSFQSKAEMVGTLMTKHSLSITTTILMGDSRDDAEAAKTCNIPFVAVAYGYGNIHLSHCYPVVGILSYPQDLYYLI